MANQPNLGDFYTSNNELTATGQFLIGNATVNAIVNSTIVSFNNATSLSVNVLTLSNTLVINAQGSNGISGQFLSTNGTAIFWSGGGGFTASASAPSSPYVGDRWLNTDTGVTYTYVQANTTTLYSWIELGPFELYTVWDGGNAGTVFRKVTLDAQSNTL